MLRRLTHIHHFPSGGEIAHVQGHVLERERRLLGALRAGVRPLRLGGRGRPRLGARRRARRRRRAPGGARVKDIFLRKEILKRPGPLQEALRRRHRRRRLARPRDRVLPRDPPRHHRRRDPREELHRLRRRRAQHDDHPRELPHARGRRLLQGERQALREALGRPRLQPDVLAARPLHARALGPLARRAERARRGEQAARDRQPRDRPRTR